MKLNLPLLLRVRWLSTKNTLFSSSSGSSRYLFILGAVLGFIFAPLAVYKMVTESMHLVSSEAVYFKILDIATVTLFSVQSISACIHTLQSLYLSQDTELLLAAPIPLKRFFKSKCIETIFASSWILLLLLMPLYIALGLSNHSSMIFFLGLLSFLGFGVFIVGCLSMITTICLTKLYPTRNLKEALLLLAIVTVFFLHSYSRSVSFIFPEIKNGTVESIQESINRWQTLVSAKTENLVIYPLKWISANQSYLNLVLFILLGVGISALSYLAASRIFCDFYSPSDTIERWQQKNNKLKHKIWIKSKYASILSFLQKDLHLFLRDLAQPVQLILFIAIGVITVMGFKQTDKLKISFTESGLIWESFLGSIIVLTHLLFTILFSGRFIFPALGLEDESSWLLKASPVSSLRFILLKFSSQSILSSLILIPVFFALAFSTDLPLDTILKLAILSFINIVTVGALAVSSGGILSLQRFEHMGQISSGLGSFIFMFVCLIIIPFNLILSFTVSAYLKYSSGLVEGSLLSLPFFCSYLLANVIISLLFLRSASRSWQK